MILRVVDGLAVIGATAARAHALGRVAEGTEMVWGGTSRRVGATDQSKEPEYGR